MVPTYRPREKYLRQTLESVLRQDPGPEQMQIEVVDDGSQDVDVAALVKSIAGERIAFSRTPGNLGLAGCWNTCLERSRGQWVHILHQDDYVLPGFYQRLEEASRAHPEVSLIAARSFFVDEEGVIWHVSERVRNLENGGKVVDDFFCGCPLQCPGVAVRRAFYEANGGYNPQFVYTLDMEMWTRIISLGGGCVIPEPLACYRSSNGNESSRLARTADDLRDFENLNRLFAERFSGFDHGKATRRLCYMAYDRVERFSKLGDSEAAAANRVFWRSHTPASLRLRKWLVEIARSIFG